MAENRTDWLVLLVFAVATLWTISMFGQLKGQSETAFIASAYFGMILICFIALLARRTPIFEFVGINKIGNELLILLGAGALIGFLLTPQANIIKNLFLNPEVPASIDPSIGLVYVVFVAVFVEEYFFRGTLMPTIEKIVSDKLGFQTFATAIAIGASSLAFIAWHLVAYQYTQDQFLPLFMFSVIQGTMVYLTNSIAPAIGAHFMVNLINFKG